MLDSFFSTPRRLRSDYAQPDGRAGELFQNSLRQIQGRTDKLFYYLLLIQYPAAVAVALIFSPLAWSGSTSTTHFHVWLAIFFGGLLTSFPIYLIRAYPAAPITRQAIAVAQMLMGALLIHLSGGRIETHFHIFGSLAFLAFYRDLRVLATATVVVSVDHLVRGLLVPESVYGMISSSYWRFIEHASWVVFENIFLAAACLQGRTQLKEMASHQVKIEEINEAIESAVRVRTQELWQRTEELAAARDAAMESTRLKSQFLANVSHEFRTPMNGVLGMTSALLETDLTRDQRDCAITVQRSAEGLLTIIKDILDLSKIEAGKLTVEPEEFLLCKEIEDVADMFANAVERKQLAFARAIDPDVPPILTGDAGRLRQVLMNLIGNAIKFTDKGEVRIHVRQIDRNGSTNRVRFEISDTGVGIPQHHWKNLFEAFVQVDGSTTRKHEGTGLGLTISKQLVHLMGGEIGFDSASGIGSTFWFELPLEVESGTDEPEFLQSGALRGLRALIVSDNPGDSQPMLTMAESWGMAAKVARDAQQALRVLKGAADHDQAFDIALLDVRMSEMERGEFTRTLRRSPQLQSTRVLMILSPEQRAVCYSPVERAILTATVLEPIRWDHVFLMIARLCGRAVACADCENGVPLEEGRDFAAIPLSVLVAEDNLVNQRVLTRLLERLGHRYDVVADGHEAVEAVKRSTYDVVLMDCQMPSKDGFEATAEIRSLSGAKGKVPIIAVTANAMSGDRERCWAAGMTGYVPKPIRFGELAEALNNAQVETLVA